jgi:hypothetical protein
MKAAPLILLGVGAVIFAIAGLVAVVTIIAAATSNGRISGDEAGPVIGLGCCCSVPGLAMAIGGLVWWLIARQQKTPLPPGGPMPPSGPPRMP